MSFGFSAGDFIGVAQLAWNLYTYCYKVAKDAPQEFKLLCHEITILSQSMHLLKEESNDPNSTFVRAGEDRARMMKEMMGRIEATLKELEKFAKKYDRLGDPSRTRKMWTKIKWSADAPELDSLRNRIAYHNGAMSLLLTSAGNSSLQRIESSNIRLERVTNEIRDMIQKRGTNGSPTPPTISVITDKASGIDLIGAALMKNAEVEQRRWLAIGIDDWIQAGRWWLMKSQMNLSTRSLLDPTACISQQGYLDLIKASWILLDVIVRHPQFDLLDPGIRYEVELLAETIRSELGNIDILGLVKPNPRDLLNCDLQIWESQARGPALQPTIHPNSARTENRLWATKNEDILFQRFGNYQTSENAKPVPCIVLFLIHKNNRVSRVVLGNQNWIVLEELSVGGVSPCCAGNSVQIEKQRIELSTSLDSRHMCAIWEAVEEYLFHSQHNGNDLEVLQAFVLLFSVKNKYWDVFEDLLIDRSGLGSQTSHSKANFAGRLRLAVEDLGSKLSKLGNSKILSNELKNATGYISAFRWAAEENQHNITTLLLEAKGVVINEKDVQEWYSLHDASRNGKIEVLRLLMSERGMSVDSFPAKTWSTTLELAAEGGHEAVVEELLKVCVDVDIDSGRALQAAAREGHEAVVDKLLRAGVDVNAYSGGALRAAAESGHKKIVGKLLKNGAKVNASTWRGSTALHEAAEKGHEAVVEKLLKIGANVNTGSEKPLQLAAREGHKVVVKGLLRAGADVNADSGLALREAVTRGHEEIVDQLLKAGADVNIGSELPLRIAAEGGRETIVGKLLKAGADVNADSGGALQAAIISRHEVVVDMLLGAGADINIGLGRALQLACKGGNEIIVDKLLKASTSVSVGLGWALKMAAEEGHETVVEKLLGAGADVNAYSGQALQAAAGEGYEAIVDRLLKAGADINADSGCALLAAATSGHEAIVDKLLKAGAYASVDSGLALRLAAQGGHEKVVSMLLEAGADVNADSGLVLQWAVEKGHEVVVDKLLEAGADANADSGWTLKLAAEKGRETLVDKLLKAGAGVTANLECALQAAAEGGHETVVDMLLRAGADADAGFGWALQAASNNGYKAIVDKLRKAGARG